MNEISDFSDEADNSKNSTSWSKADNSKNSTLSMKIIEISFWVVIKDVWMTFSKNEFAVFLCIETTIDTLEW